MFQLLYSLSRIIPDNPSCFRQECFISKGRCQVYIKKNSDQDIAEILLRLALNPSQSINQSMYFLLQLVTIKGSPESATEACKEIYMVVQTEAQSLNKG